MRVFPADKLSVYTISSDILKSAYPSPNSGFRPVKNDSTPSAQVIFNSIPGAGFPLESTSLICSKPGISGSHNGVCLINSKGISGEGEGVPDAIWVGAGCCVGISVMVLSTIGVGVPVSAVVEDGTGVTWVEVPRMRVATNVAVIDGIAVEMDVGALVWLGFGSGVE